jgi:UDP-N-acetylmuramoyl-tripeptide--D-alanyl-D-alanine ligase
MPAIFANLLADWTGGQWFRTPVRPMQGFVTDTRMLRPGQVFVALKTPKRDGHDFLASAQLAGASGSIVGRIDTKLVIPQLIVRDPLEALQTIGRKMRENFPGPVVGVTGSAGKTSTKDLLAVLLGGHYPVLATEGNFNNHIGVPLTLTRLDPPMHQFAVIEAGISGPGEMDVLAGMIQPNLAVVTLIGAAHLQRLGGVEGVAREKSRLPAALRPDGLLVTHEAVNNFKAFHDLSVRRLLARGVADPRAAAADAANIVRYAVEHGAETTTITLAFRATAPRTYTLRRVSDGMAQNAVLAMAAALEIGVIPDVLQIRLATWVPTTLRAEIRREGGRLLYLDCYNANPDSMCDALASFLTQVPEDLPRLYVFGGMEDLGVLSAEYHRQVGQKIRLRPQDRAFMIGENAGAMCAGAIEVDNEPDLISVVGSLEPIAEAIAAFQGAVFMKGSRRWELEKALVPVVPKSAPC